MKIEINNSKTIEIVEPFLTVVSGKLFNTDTKRYEAIDGDKVYFYVLDKFGNKCWIRGKVEGYTCNRRIKLQDVNDLYAMAEGSEKCIEHLSSITDMDSSVTSLSVEDVVMRKSIKTVIEEEWDAVLCEQ